ncbi:hypothetical protein VaNZ11_011970 [Volvox africanus]|uniref:Autophagy protein 5 n=1 Tax=Volvox africanus TaxID=51714 RepID=A0ABQ5SEE2_9CHLO|nr:hypothetical protein VaNZ11_011970 [Volvox africanus]
MAMRIYSTDGKTPMKQVQAQTWHTKIPVHLSLAPDNISSPTGVRPIYLMAPRQGYLHVVASQAWPHLQHVLPSIPGRPGPPRPWFDNMGVPLKWYLPCGVLYDLLADLGQLPWRLTVHYTYPPDILVGWDTGATPQAQFMNSLKEACYICRGTDGSGAVMRMGSTAQEELWSAVQAGNVASYQSALEGLKMVPTPRQGHPPNIPVRLLLRRGGASASASISNTAPTTRDALRSTSVGDVSPGPPRTGLPADAAALPSAGTTSSPSGAAVTMSSLGSGGVWESCIMSTSRPVPAQLGSGGELTTLAHLLHVVLPHIFPPPPRSASAVVEVRTRPAPQVEAMTPSPSPSPSGATEEASGTVQVVGRLGQDRDRDRDRGERQELADVRAEAISSERGSGGWLGPVGEAEGSCVAAGQGPTETTEAALGGGSAARSPGQGATVTIPTEPGGAGGGNGGSAARDARAAAPGPGLEQSVEQISGEHRSRPVGVGAGIADEKVACGVRAKGLACSEAVVSAAAGPLREADLVAATSKGLGTWESRETGNQSGQSVEGGGPSVPSPDVSAGPASASAATMAAGPSGAAGCGNSVAASWPSYRILVGGITPPLAAPIAWLHAAMHAPDLFLYVVVRMDLEDGSLVEADL